MGGIDFFTILVLKGSMAKQDNFVRYTIRVPAEIYDRVLAAAESSGRSVNAEIVQRLEASLTQRLIIPIDVSAGKEWKLLFKESVKESVTEYLRDSSSAQSIEGGPLGALVMNVFSDEPATDDTSNNGEDPDEKVNESDRS
ncbi:Arc family DNA-binding protein [Sinorhizobium fredii]|uniref:Arc family DNA-binding protein n=2 Tax=Rhizobium fredii TaxID=380 RepID=A0A2A6LXT4_RHIFR|nr:Arc family DNA-binding protein [Sinorhizobium fredii]PDT46969.1 Arc family DNA-binding protein [Sinorhizobium fredii]